MADNVLGTLFQSIADAIRNKTGDTGKIVPADFPNEINSIVVGSGGSGGTETGVGDLKIAKGSFYGGDGFRKTINHGLGTMPDLVVVWYSGLDSDVNGELSEKAALSFSCGLRSSMSEVTTYKGYQHYFASIGLDASKYIDDSANTIGIYCPDDNTFEVGAPSGSVAGVFADSSYNWLAISGMGGVIGGSGSAEGCVTVTFKNGDEVLFTRPVYVGDDCPDPITQGHISTPTKESTVQYDYTHNGWSLSDGSSADSSVLKNITANKTVYAAYEQTARKYTITYYDEDGTTVLKTEQVAYGTKPSYIPSKDGYGFNGWTPALTSVTGDASYTASFIQTIVVMDWSGTIASTSLTHGLYSTVNAFSHAEGDTFIAEVDGVSYTTKVFKVNVSYSSSSGFNNYYVVGDPYKWLNQKGERPTVKYANNNTTFPNNYSNLPFCCQFYSYSSKTDVSFNFTTNGPHTIKLMKVF